MDFQNWPIRYFDGLKHEHLRIIQMLCAITLMCYLLLPMQLVPLQECIKLNFSKILSSIFEIFFRKKVKLWQKRLLNSKNCVRHYFGKNTVNTVVSSENLFQHIAKRWWSLTWLDLVFRPSAPYFIKNAYIQILSMHEKKKVKKKINQNPSSICWKKCSSMYVVLRIF